MSVVSKMTKNLVMLAATLGLMARVVPIAADRPIIRDNKSSLMSEGAVSARKVLINLKREGLTDAELSDIRKSVPGIVKLQHLKKMGFLVATVADFQSEEATITQFNKHSNVKAAVPDVILYATDDQPKGAFRGLRASAPNRETALKMAEITKHLGEKKKMHLEGEKKRAGSPQGYEKKRTLQGASSYIPNDSGFSELWGMNQNNDIDIDAPEAWSVMNQNGVQPPAQPVVVAVIDSGIDYAHQDLASRMWVNPGEIPNNGIDDDENGYIDDVYGYNFHGGNGDPWDDNGHGTHCAGTIAAIDNNAKGVAGVVSYVPAGSIQLMALKFLGSTGSGSLSGAIEALEYAALMGATLSNNSWGGGHLNSAQYELMMDALNTLAGQEHLFVAAAGNSNEDISDTSDVPCYLPADNMMCVASTTKQGTLSSFSNYGDIVNVAAPGSDIYSTTPNDKYEKYSGTSMACPHVAGLVALLKIYRPNLKYSQIQELIYSTVDQKDYLDGKVVTKGRINAEKAITQAKFQYGPQYPPLTKVTSVSFTDTNPSVGRLSGSMNVGFEVPLGGTNDASEVQVWFLSSNMTRISSKLAVTHEPITPLTFNLDVAIANANVPSGAAYLSAFTANMTGMSTSYGSIVVNDLGYPTENARNVAVGADLHTKAGHFSGFVSFKPATSEVDITDYSIYLTNANLEKVQLVTKVVAWGYSDGTCTGSCEKITMTPWEDPLDSNIGGTIFSRYDEGVNYDPGESALIIVAGPGKIMFTHFDVEDYYDWLEIDGVKFTGHSIPDPVEIGPGTHQIKWFSDFMVGMSGWTFQYQMNMKYSYLANIPTIPAAADRFMVVPAYNDKEAIISPVATPTATFTDDTSGGDNGGMPPTTTPKSAKFYDNNIAGNKIAGTIELVSSGGADILELGVWFNEYAASTDAEASPISSTKIGTCVPVASTPAPGMKGCAVPVPTTSLTPGKTYRFEIKEGNTVGWSFATPLRIAAMDVEVEAMGGAVWSGDLDATVGEVAGDIALIPGMNSIGVTGYVAYWSETLADPHAPGSYFAETALPIVCPPTGSNQDQIGAQTDNEYAKLDCTNPYSPKCMGKSCDKITIMSEGNDFYIANLNYTNNEFAKLYFPYGGKLEVIQSEIEKFYDKLVAKWRDDLLDLAYNNAGDIIQVVGGTKSSYLHWTSDFIITKGGFALKYSPNYPKITIPENTPVASTKAGVKIVPVYHNYKSSSETTDALGITTRTVASGHFDNSHAFEGTSGAVWSPIEDYIVSTATCGATTMKCPIPSAWADQNYVLPMPKGKASCMIQRPSANNAYFEFTKTDCGATRTFDSSRGMIIDSIVIEVDGSSTVTSTTTASGGIMDFIDFLDDDNSGPVTLAPKVNCRCESGWDASAAVGTTLVANSTPAPVTAEDIDVVGEGKLEASMRLFQDPTFTLPQPAGEVIPPSTRKFYVEVATTFVENKVTISDCEAARTEFDFTSTESNSTRVDIINDYCPNEVLAVADIAPPSGMTHLQRISFRKFKFSDSSEIFMRCKVRACETQPCGVCANGAGLQSVNQFRALRSERIGGSRKLKRDAQLGEIFTPTIRIIVDPDDDSAKPTSTNEAESGASFPSAQLNQAKEPAKIPTQEGAQPGTDAVLPEDAVLVPFWTPEVVSLDDALPEVKAKEEKIVEDKAKFGVIASKITFAGLSADWAVQNRDEMADALKTTLKLSEGEEIRITRISKVEVGANTASRRNLSATEAMNRSRNMESNHESNNADDSYESEKKTSNGKNNLRGIVPKASAVTANSATEPANEVEVFEGYQDLTAKLLAENPGFNQPIKGEMVVNNGNLRVLDLMAAEKAAREREGRPTKMADLLAAGSPDNYKVKEQFKDENRRRLTSLAPVPALPIALAAAPASAVHQSPRPLHPRTHPRTYMSRKNFEAKAKRALVQKEKVKELFKALKDVKLRDRKLAGAERVSIDFEIIMKQKTKIADLESKMTLLASSAPEVTSNFVAELDKELEKKGKTPVKLETDALVFAQPKMTVGTEKMGEISPSTTPKKQTPNTFGNTKQAVTNPNGNNQNQSEKSAVDMQLLLIVGGGIVLFVTVVAGILITYWKKNSAQLAELVAKTAELQKTTVNLRGSLSAIPGRTGSKERSNSKEKFTNKVAPMGHKVELRMSVESMSTMDTEKSPKVGDSPKFLKNSSLNIPMTKLSDASMQTSLYTVADSNLDRYMSNPAMERYKSNRSLESTAWEMPTIDIPMKRKEKASRHETMISPGAVEMPSLAPQISKKNSWIPNPSKTRASNRYIIDLADEESLEDDDSSLPDEVTV